jgi:hypothetical protein
MHKVISSAVSLLGIAAIATPGLGQTPPVPRPKVAVHLGLHEVATAICDGAPELHGIDCGSVATDGDLMTGYDLYIVIAQGDSTKGIAGLTFGIQYDDAPGSGVDLMGTPKFALCANGLQYPSATWPASGSGNSITWNPETGCQRTVLPPYGVHATAGAFYVYAYSEDRFMITPHSKLQTPVLSVADCSAVLTELTSPGTDSGWAAFGELALGCTPCIFECIIAAEPVTWGRVKAMFPGRNE